MDKKKALLVIIVAALLAFATVSILTKKNSTEEVIETETQQEVVAEETNNENVDISIEEEMLENVTIKPPVIKTNIKPIVKPIPPVVEQPVFKPLQVEVTKEGVAAEEKVDPGVMKEASSGNVIVTREFKSKSRNRYVFEGFGIQVAPTK